MSGMGFKRMAPSERHVAVGPAKAHTEGGFVWKAPQGLTLYKLPSVVGCVGYRPFAPIGTETGNHIIESEVVRVIVRLIPKAEQSVVHRKGKMLWYQLKFRGIDEIEHVDMSLIVLIIEKLVISCPLVMSHVGLVVQNQADIEVVAPSLALNGQSQLLFQPTVGVDVGIAHRPFHAVLTVARVVDHRYLRYVLRLFYAVIDLSSGSETIEQRHLRTEEPACVTVGVLTVVIVTGSKPYLIAEGTDVAICF